MLGRNDSQGPIKRHIILVQMRLNPGLKLSHLQDKKIHQDMTGLVRQGLKEMKSQSASPMAQNLGPVHACSLKTPRPP